MKRKFNQRRPQRRPFRPSTPGPQRDPVEPLARALMDGKSIAELEAILAERQFAFDEADQLGQNDPSPANLLRYRAARAELDAAERALELARRESPSA